MRTFLIEQFLPDATEEEFRLAVVQLERRFEGPAPNESGGDSAVAVSVVVPGDDVVLTVVHADALATVQDRCHGLAIDRVVACIVRETGG